MTGPRGRRLAVAAVAIVAIVAVATIAWVVQRSRPDAVGPRLVEALLARHPGASVVGWDAGVLRLALASGLYVDVQPAPLFATCEAHRLDCGRAIDDGTADVDRVIAAAAAPSVASLEAAVVAEPTPGFRYGFVTDPLVQPLEVRYALVAGIASTFVTAAIADRLGLSHDALRAAAATRLCGDRDVSLEPLAPGTGDDAATVYRVRAAGDPVASLLDPERMAALAGRLHVRRLSVGVPARRMLLVTGPAGTPALLRRLDLRDGPDARPGQVGLLRYDLDTPDAPLSFAPRPTGAR